MAKTVELDRTTIFPNGTVEVRLKKLSSDGDYLGAHTQVIEADESVEEKMGELAAALLESGFSAPDQEVLQAVHSVAPIARTPTKVKAAEDRRTAIAAAAENASSELPSA